MFRDHPLTPNIKGALATLPFDVALEIERTFRDYERMAHMATRDREAVLGFLDGLSRRLDDLPADPGEARERACQWAQNALEDGR